MTQSLPGPGLSALHVFALYLLAFAQPLLDLLARSPTFFVAHHAGAVEILMIAGMLCFGLPLPALAVLFLAGRFMPALGRALTLGCVALFAGLIVLGLIERLGDLPWLPTLLAAAAGGATIALGYQRVPALRSFATVCSVAIVVVPGALLGSSPVSSLLASASTEPVIARVDSSVPVVYAIFDELPLPGPPILGL